ncbi:DUF1810 domain-containing protein [Neorhizobium lilium]|uniref:DUF1810 domain-containing protein n=1 Tax=Neorhizobium lilium TaxID=2503024 RepID=A0A3S3RV63_9HYPH|nr:DUF1810 domain-containing protein [Neorhizobium lilium]RWX78979.1 DUF1810 domain-containing protein [Neorhizobium lilium]
MTADEFRLVRFLDAQAPVYEEVLRELRNGRKRTHWMWYIFPQVAGLGFSIMAERFAIGSRKEAEAYLTHPILGIRLTESTEAMLGHEGLSAHAILGSPDDLKFKSSMTLFEAVSKKGSPFERALEQYYGGERDERTLALLR